LAFTTFGALLSFDASAALTRGSGGLFGGYYDHNIVIKCTHERHEGEWDAGIDPSGPTVSQHVDETNKYALCAGFDASNITEPPASLLSCLENDPITDPNDENPYDDIWATSSTCPYPDLGYGWFESTITYTSGSVEQCVEDANSGIGNNCQPTDCQNKKHNDGCGVVSTGSTVACKDNTGGGTTTTYQFYASPDVNVTGYIKLVKNVQWNLDHTPGFTNCSSERIMADKCVEQWGGWPTTTVKVKGKLVDVIDWSVIDEAFPDADIPNALDSGQYQHLANRAVLFYEEVDPDGKCSDGISTLNGVPKAAYARYCTSDIDTFTDNVGTNWFVSDPTDPTPTGDGYDNELRPCFKNPNYVHTASADAERIQLTGTFLPNVTSQPVLNLNCDSGNPNNDGGGFKVQVYETALLPAADFVTSGADAPLLEGVSPSKASDVLTDSTGLKYVELTYPTCPDLSHNVIDNNPSATNNTDVTLHLTNMHWDTSSDSLDYDSDDSTGLSVKVNGL